PAHATYRQRRGSGGCGARPPGGGSPPPRPPPPTRRLRAWCGQRSAPPSEPRRGRRPAASACRSSRAGRRPPLPPAREGSAPQQLPRPARRRYSTSISDLIQDLADHFALVEGKLFSAADLIGFVSLAGEQNDIVLAG